MNRSRWIFLSLIPLVLFSVVGCRGGYCGNCGGYGYQQYPQNVMPPGYVQPGYQQPGYAQPGYAQPGVTLPPQYPQQGNTFNNPGTIPPGGVQ